MLIFEVALHRARSGAFDAVGGTDGGQGGGRRGRGDGGVGVLVGRGRFVKSGRALGLGSILRLTPGDEQGGGKCRAVGVPLTGETGCPRSR